MMTPVESGSTCRLSMPSSRATVAQVDFAFSMPSSPVPALATPVLTRIARIGCFEARCSRQRMTGAAAKRLRVNTPATRPPSSIAMSSRSLRLGLRMPARATPSRTPAMVSRFSGRGDSKLTAMSALWGLTQIQALDATSSLVFDPRHGVRVHVATRAQSVGAMRALDLESELAVQRDGALVVDIDRELEPDHVEPVVGELDDRAHEGRAHTLALPVGFHRHA